MESFLSTNCEPVVIKIMNDDDIINGGKECGESRGIANTAQRILVMTSAKQ